MKSTLTLLTSLLAALPVQAAQVQDLRGREAQAELARYEAAIKAKPDDAAALKSAGIILHQLARTDMTRDKVETAERYLKEAQKLQPQDTEITAWLGSVITMKAKFETDPGKETFFVKSGTRLMDKAIQQAPDNTVVRLTRAYNSIELPSFLMRTKFAVEDFKYYLQLCAARECPPDYVADARAELARAEKIVADNR